MPGRNLDVGEYVDAMYPRFVEFAFKMSGHQQDAEDIVQEAMAKLVSRWDRVTAAEHPDSYVYRIILNTRNSLWRRAFRRHERTVWEVADDIAQPDHQVDKWVTSATLMAGLAQLTTEERRVLVAEDVGRLSWLQISEAMHLSEATAKRRRAAALTKLRAYFEDPHE